MKPTVSIIIPVYNSGEFLIVQVESILAQTYSDFELLLVDDGSTDGITPQLCDEFAAKDNRVRVFHKQNGGVSSARNLGLSYVVGEYVVFADSDDYMFPDCLEVMCREIQGYDLLISSYIHGIRSDLEKACIGRKNVVGGVICGASLEDIRLYNIIPRLGYSNCVVWSQMFRRDVILEYNLVFQKINSEDELFSFEYLQHVSSVKEIDFQGYFYIHNQNSLSSSHRSIAEMEYIDKMEKIYENLFLRFSITDKDYFHTVNWRIAVRYASFLQKGYYADTRMPYLKRMARWKEVHNRKWIRHRISLRRVPRNTAIVLGICRLRLYYILDPFLLIGEWLHRKHFF